MTSSANSRGFSRMGVDPTISGLVDGTDFPHSALFHALNIATQGSYAIIEGNDFDITQSDSSGKTQFAVAAGKVVREGELQAAVSAANFTQGTPAAFEEPASGFAYYLLVVNSSNALELKNNGGTVITDTVPNPATTDIPIAVLRLGSGETTTQRHVQFLTTAKKSNSLSVAYENSGVYTEEGKITADSNGGIDIITTQTDEDIRITPNGNGKIVLDGQNWPTSGGSANQFLKTDGSNQLSYATVSEDLVVTLTGGTGITTSGTYPNFTITNSAPDQTVSLTGAGITTVTGTYPNFTITSTEAQTLQDVTSIGASTTIGIQNDGYRRYNIPTPAAGLTDLTNGLPPTFSHYYVNTAVSPLDAGHSGQVITIKNIHTSSIGITHATAFEGGTHPTTDQRFGSPTVITLESYESITLQYLLDSAGVPTATWYIIDLDTSGGGGLADVIDDTTPQLGGMLDVNGQSLGDGTLELLKFSETASAVNEFTIANAATGNPPKLSATGDDTNIGIEIETKGTGDIILDGDVSIDAGHTFRATTLPVVDINSDPNPLVLDTHAGRYLLCSSNITLPATSTQGDQYYLLNDSASSISIQRNGNNINGAASDVTLTSYKGATCIAIGSNNWIVLGV